MCNFVVHSIEGMGLHKFVSKSGIKRLGFLVKFINRSASKSPDRFNERQLEKRD